MNLDFQNKLFSYGVLNILSFIYFYSYRITQLKNIPSVNYFIFLSPIVLAAIFYCLQKPASIKKGENELLQNIIYPAGIIIVWFIMLKILDRIYNDHISLINYVFDPINNILYLVGFFIIILIFVFIARKKLNIITTIALCYLVSGVLFLKTLNSIKERNGIETYYFVDPYIILMSFTLFLWFLCIVFFSFLGRINPTNKTKKDG